MRSAHVPTGVYNGFRHMVNRQCPPEDHVINEKTCTISAVAWNATVTNNAPSLAICPDPHTKYETGENRVSKPTVLIK